MPTSSESWPSAPASVRGCDSTRRSSTRRSPPAPHAASRRARIARGDGVDRTIVLRAQRAGARCCPSGGRSRTVATDNASGAAPRQRPAPWHRRCELRRSSHATRGGGGASSPPVVPSAPRPTGGQVAQQEQLSFVEVLKALAELKGRNVVVTIGALEVRELPH